MELILMSLLTIVALVGGILLGKAWGEDTAYQVGWDAGYEEGLIEGFKNRNSNVENFPTSLDGKFFSREMAIKQMSMKEGD